ncbi:FHA domain-containing protein [Steroidobacter sp.]|uniref:FHA domain-containing protein n=1 Tax=Steroidobacter sp. TaxID=1978227 RepID=UPI001A3FDA50|nr:FHA domain-containing protein [Steroidobacter sp.]MBL8269478.1 FHA domain-containing protein [Steroidobacter sp.]
MLALELIDAALVVARKQGESVEVVADAPGVALLEDSQTVTGLDALQRVRRQPLLAHTNFWRGLSTQPLSRPSRVAGTAADVAFAQAEKLLGQFKQESEGVLLAVPAGYNRDQLGLLLGVINETGVRVAGLVDAALAACSLEPAPARVLHLDLELHQALLTVLEYSGGEHPGLKRSRYEIALRHGLLGIQQSLVQFIAENFVRKTRFDPLHDANSEQRLVDQLPAWLAELQQAETVTLSFQFGERELQLEVERSQLIAAAEPHYLELLRLVQGARVAGMPIELRLSQRVASMPGLLDRFRTLRDCTIQVLPPAAAAWGTLQYAGSIRRAPDSLALVYQLPVPRADSGDVESSDVEATPPQLRPTHVLFQGRAWSITEQPLTIGWAVEGRARALTLPNALPGISRAHCTLVRRNGAVMVEDHSTYGSFVNDEKVSGRTPLTVGDRLRLGSPGVTLDLIQLVNDHGTPQD